MKKDLLKFPLKRVLLSTVILCSLSAIISSCGEEEGRISVNDAAPEKVTNVTTKAGPGEVTLSWTNPEKLHRERSLSVRVLHLRQNT
jgi:hypothetical protein